MCVLIAPPGTVIAFGGSNGIEIQENNKYDIPIFSDLYEATEFVISQ